MAQKQTFSLKDFSGGLNQRVNSTMIKDNQSPDLLNCYIDQGSIVKREGCRRWNQTAISTAPVTSLYRFYREDGTKKLMALCGTKLYVLPDNGTAATEVTGSTFTSGARLEFTSYINNLYMTNQDGYFKYDNSSITSYGLESAPAGKWIVPHGDNRVWVANSENERSRVWFCGDSDPTSWAINDNYFDVSSDDGDEITGLAAFMEDLIIFKDNSIWVAQGTYDPENELSLTKRVTDAGCVSGRSIATINNRIYFLGKEGVYEFDGVAARIISEPIENIIKDINPAQKENAVAVGVDSKYYLSFAPLGSTSNKTMVVYDILSRSWTKYDGKYAEAADMVVLSGADDANQILVGSSQATGMVYQLNYGYSDDGDSGTASSGTPTTLVDSTKVWSTNLWEGNTLQITEGTGIGQSVSITSNTATALTIAGGASGTLSGFTQDTTATLTDAGMTWTDGEFVGKTIYITGGTGSGQNKVITANTADTITTPTWTTPLDATSTYEIMAWTTQPDATSKYTIVGDAINFYYYTKHFSLDVPESRKKFKKIWVYADASGDYNLNIDYLFDLATSGTTLNVPLLGPGAKWGQAYWGQAVWGGTSMINEKLQAAGKGRYFQFKFYNSGAEQPVSIIGLSAQMKVKRPK